MYTDLSFSQKISYIELLSNYQDRLLSLGREYISNGHKHFERQS